MRWEWACRSWTHLSSRSGPSHWTRSCDIMGRRRPVSSSSSCPNTLSRRGCRCRVPLPRPFAIRFLPKMSALCRGTCLWSVASAPWFDGMRSPWSCVPTTTRTDWADTSPAFRLARRCTTWGLTIFSGARRMGTPATSCTTKVTVHRVCMPART